MSKIKIETLTCVHVGSGVFLKRGNDFVLGKSEDNYSEINIVNLRKALQLIGEENINAWVSAIEKGRPIDSVMKQFAPKAKPSDYSDRNIMMWAEETTDTLKEFIHDGLGKPYLPGSSIKGAIRTAVLATVADNIGRKEDKIKDKKYRRGQPITDYTAKKVEQETFGSNPNEDVFRFLQVGDAIFGKNYEAAVMLVNINERDNNSYWDTSKKQLVEVLTDGDEATFDLKINTPLYERAKHKVHPLPSCMKDVNTLFETINKHTLSLLESETAYWEVRKNNEHADNVDNYLEKLSTVKKATEECSSHPGTCVMRMGHGSGWRFITGAWTEKLNNFNEVIGKARPKNYNYTGYDFPKSRRVDDQCELLGFVRLTIIDK